MQQLAILEGEGAALRFQIEGDYNLADIGEAVEALIALLDRRFAPFDPDEPIFTHAEREDDHGFAPLSDDLPGDPDDAEPEEDLEAGAYVEWHTKPPNLRRRGQPEILASDNEDDEEDDAPEEDDDSGQNSEDEQSSGIHSYGWRPTGAGCEISDTGIGDGGGLHC